MIDINKRENTSQSDPKKRYFFISFDAPDKCAGNVLIMVNGNSFFSLEQTKTHIQKTLFKEVKKTVDIDGIVITFILELSESDYNAFNS